MAHGTQCDLVIGFVVRYRSYGGFIESSPVLSEAQLPGFIQEIGGPQLVVAIIPVTQSGQPADCCPEGYQYDPKTNSCITQPTCQNPLNVPKNPDGTCPAGYVVDPTDPGCCKPAPPCQNPNNVPENPDGTCPRGYIPDPTDPGCCMPCLPPAPQPDGGDELGDCCALIVFELEQLVLAVQRVSLGAPQQTSQCCTEIVQGIGGVTTKLGQIVKLVGRLADQAGEHLDLSLIVKELKCLCDELTIIAHAPPLDLSPVTNALRAIDSTLERKKPTDVAGIVKAIKDQTTEFTVNRAIGDALVQGGFINKDVAQLITGGSSGDWSVAGIATHLKEFFYGVVLGATGFDPHNPVPTLPTGAQIQNWLTSAISNYLKTSDTILDPVIKGILDAIKAQVSPASTPPLGSAGVSQDQAVESATAVAVTALLASIVVDYFGWDIGESTARIAEVAAAAVGFEELRDVQVGPLVRHGIARVAEMNARALFQQDIPGAGQVANLLSRGLLDATTAELLYGWNGLHTSLRKQVSAGAARGISPFQVFRLTSAGILSDADVIDEMTFAGIRPKSQQHLLQVAKYLASDPERKALKTALEAAAVGGLLSDTDLLNNLDAADQNLDRHNLVLQTAHWKQLTAETKEIEREYSNVFKSGLIDDATFRNDLAGLRLTPSYINFVAGKAEVAANVTLQLRTIREARALARETAAIERRTAFEAYSSGTINEAALTTALAATGLTTTEALAWTAFAVLRAKGTPRFIFGLKLDPQSAELLKARVTDLTDQRKRQLISEAAYTTALAALNVPARWINALNAGAEAMLTPKSAAFPVPVQTG